MKAKGLNHQEIIDRGEVVAIGFDCSVCGAEVCDMDGLFHPGFVYCPYCGTEFE